MNEQPNQSEIRCELVDSRQEILKDCEKPVTWLISCPFFLWTACDEHYQFFKLDAERVQFDRVVRYEPFTIDSYLQNLRKFVGD